MGGNEIVEFGCLRGLLARWMPRTQGETGSGGFVIQPTSQMDRDSSFHGQSYFAFAASGTKSFRCSGVSWSIVITLNVRFPSVTLEVPPKSTW